MYQLVIDSDAGMLVRLVIVFSNLTMNMVRKNFDEGLGASIKKLTGGKMNEELRSRAYVHMYLGDDPFDKDAKEKFGTFALLSTKKHLKVNRPGAEQLLNKERIEIVFLFLFTDLVMHLIT
ncbi:CHI protein [Pyrus ussuriensis x Pyrus communis]|uniref:CHI protein n=1 Tax=Pyrus ussuriensis x Pyrus communis TaxID=2448454 RepID=A0A5N5FU05_9ROSA|nr:CHI protein [Pyrus ussuriensis x Pyrus communis]